MHFSFQCTALLDEASQELVTSALVEVCFFPVLLDFILCLQVGGMRLFHVFVNAAESILVLVHAESQTVFELFLLSKDRRVVDLLDGLPLLFQVLLHVDDHIVAVPLAAMLHILNERVPDFAHFDTCQYLSNFALVDSVPSFLKRVERFLHGLSFHGGVLQLGLSQSHLFKRAFVFLQERKPSSSLDK